MRFLFPVRVFEGTNSFLAWFYARFFRAFYSGFRSASPQMKSFVHQFPLCRVLRFTSFTVSRSRPFRPPFLSCYLVKALFIFVRMPTLLTCAHDIFPLRVEILYLRQKNNEMTLRSMHDTVVIVSKTNSL